MWLVVLLHCIIIGVPYAIGYFSDLLILSFYDYFRTKGDEKMNSSVIANKVKSSPKFENIRIVGEHSHGHWHAALPMLK